MIAVASQKLESTQPPLGRMDEPACLVELPQFEGPLDLLLHLIQQHELDILDIPIGFVTERYLSYLALMQSLSIDVASEYLVMAATLAHIKSKMLLPVVPDNQEDDLEDEQLDPRMELVRRLLEYQKYKHAAGQLAQRSREGQDVFRRGSVEQLDEPAERPAVASSNVFVLIDAFHSLLKRRSLHVDHHVDLERVTITERIQQIATALQEHRKLTLEQLLPERFDRADLVVTFLAMLEMVRMRMILIEQSEHLGSIYLEMAVKEQQDELSDAAAHSSSHEQSRTSAQ